MKEKLDEDSKKALVTYRIQRAYETLKEAEVMKREAFYNAAINRLYYACYYAAIALLLKYDIQQILQCLQFGAFENLIIIPINIIRLHD